MSILFYIGELMKDYDKAVLKEIKDKKAQERIASYEEE
jgi:hypothetical protein